MRKINKVKFDAMTMFSMLKADLKKADSVSYNADSIVMMVKGERVVWSVDSKVNLERWDDKTETTAICKERLLSVKWQGVFIGYMVVEFITANWPLFGMVQIQA